MNAPLKPEALASVAFELDGRPVEPSRAKPS